MHNPKLLLIALIPAVLAACENSAVSYQAEGSSDTVSLLREQRYVWNKEVEQMIVPARVPKCQRRHHIDADTTSMQKMELFEVRPMLFVAHQGKNWYAIGTEACQLEKFDKPPENPGRLLGTFEQRDGTLAFVPTGASKPLK